MNFSLFKQNFLEYSNKLIRAFLRNYVTHMWLKLNTLSKQHIHQAFTHSKIKK